MRCQNGHENTEGASFCQECGVRVTPVEERGQNALGKPTQRHQPIGTAKGTSHRLRVLAGVGAAAFVLAIGVGVGANAFIHHENARVASAQHEAHAANARAIKAQAAADIATSRATDLQTQIDDQAAADAAVVMTPSQLQSALLGADNHDGTTNIAASLPVEISVDGTGAGTYQSVLTTNLGQSTTKTITVDSTGNWLANQ